MDYIFRWLNLRFLSGEQLTLFAGLAPQAPALPVSPSLLPETEPEEDGGISQGQLARLAEEVARKLNEVSGQTGAIGQGSLGLTGTGMGSTSAPAGAIAPEVEAEGTEQARPTHGPGIQDRGVYHASDAMRDLYDMGDAPSCGVCGAIMVRNGSCYRCMSCGSTSGCS
jgi:ribonucleoside-diphosphate reductase alpha chain